MGTATTYRRLTADELRDTWFAFFEERGHVRKPSASLVPENDPTLLFTGAGMNQFKEYFSGHVKAPDPRATTIQKCFRQGDLENVGRTPRHLTFFEMLGHFSFGDYFKSEAIGWAWEFMTRVLEVPEERLWVSVYREDDEAFDVWRKLGVPRSRIARFGADENFWPANAPKEGPNGVCGPCSEVYFDYGEEYAKGNAPEGEYDSGRFIEIWNSVFTQFERRGVDDLVPLPQKNIDCGVGFERVLAMIEGQYSVFSTSLFRPLLEAIGEIAGVSYPFLESGAMPDTLESRRMRRIADHVRSACFLVADGVKPSNEGRGYVLRRVLRRAIRDGIQLGLEDPFLGELVSPVAAMMGRAYPTVVEGETVIRSILETEEQNFRRTYMQGVRFLEAETRDLRQGGVLTGAKAFRLYDTYGFPVDLAARILEERGIRVDVDGFEREMGKQQERARAGSKISDAIFAGGPLSDLRSREVETTAFEGYDTPGTDATQPEDRGVSGTARVVGLVVGDALVEAVDEGGDVTVVLDRSPFYAESGGQVGDRGVLEADGLLVDVRDTQAREGYVLHEGRVRKGRLETGHEVRAHVDEDARDATRRNHTATHLLHAALREVLGDEVRQEGSLVAPNHLRFDFSHSKAMSADELQALEDLVNRWILRNDPVETAVMGLEDAKASGAMSLFGEKYADDVRVVGVASGSRELCGGTHCRRTGDIGCFRITQEASVAAGVRRIEAVTGLGAVSSGARDRHLVQKLGAALKAAPEEILERVAALQEDLKAMRKAEEKAKRDAGLQAVGQLAETAVDLGGLRVQIASLPGVDGKALRGVWDGLRKAGVDVGVLVGAQGGRAPLLVGLSKDALARDLEARALLAVAAEVLGGRGGGRPELAQGQGQDASQVEAALERVRGVLSESLG